MRIVFSSRILNVYLILIDSLILIINCYIYFIKYFLVIKSSKYKGYIVVWLCDIIVKYIGDNFIYVIEFLINYWVFLKR